MLPIEITKVTTKTTKFYINLPESQVRHILMEYLKVNHGISGNFEFGEMFGPITIDVTNHDAD